MLKAGVSSLWKVEKQISEHSAALFLHPDPSVLRSYAAKQELGCESWASTLLRRHISYCLLIVEQHSRQRVEKM